MSATQKRFLTAFVSAAVAAVLATGLTRLLTDEEPPSVTLVDSVAEIEQTFAERDAAGERRSLPGGIPRLRIPPRAAERFFPSIGKAQTFDPDLLSRHKPDLNLTQKLKEHPRKGWRLVTNSLGLREDGEPAAEKPDLRVLVVGDSHVDGVCDNADSFPNLLEDALAEAHPGRAIEVLNGGTGGWSFYNYLGALEGLADLAPDVFVVTVYGGNDFYAALDLHHYHRREPLPAKSKQAVGTLVRLAREHAGIAAQWYNQVAYFHDHPEEEAAALSMAVVVTEEIARRCDELGAELLVVYLPPYAPGQPARFTPYLELAREHLPMSPAAEAVDERLADGWLAALAERGIRAVDLRPVLRASPEPAYWESDHHINLLGQRLVADALRPHVESLAGL